LYVFAGVTAEVDLRPIERPAVRAIRIRASTDQGLSTIASGIDDVDRAEIERLAVRRAGQRIRTLHDRAGDLRETGLQGARISGVLRQVDVAEVGSRIRAAGRVGPAGARGFREPRDARVRTIDRLFATRRANDEGLNSLVVRHLNRLHHGRGIDRCNHATTL